MSSKITDLRIIGLRIERAADHQRMVIARRQVVARARALVLPRLQAANDPDPQAA
ncbi:MAG: hypothetical protein ACK41C_02635 [Phenylobacterium sp.]|uniref:hypothetical protein n=1 Tax=Phenylobacterium sp. TaxID=1871053 RepID=UPI00391C7BD1